MVEDVLPPTPPAPARFCAPAAILSSWRRCGGGGGGPPEPDPPVPLLSDPSPELPVGALPGLTLLATAFSRFSVEYPIPLSIEVKIASAAEPSPWICGSGAAAAMVKMASAKMSFFAEGMSILVVW